MRSWRIGDVVVHRIDEAILPPPTAAWLLPDVTPEQAADTGPDFRHDDGSLRLATQLGTHVPEPTGVRLPRTARTATS